MIELDCSVKDGKICGLIEHSISKQLIPNFIITRRRNSTGLAIIIFQLASST